VVVDQLPVRSLENVKEDRGIGRLWREGVALTARYPYALTFTAPGHATLATGTTPNRHGVPANAWYDRTRHTVVTATRAESATPSATALRVETLAQALQRAGQRALAVSLKDRGALMLAGAGVPAFWMRVDLGVAQGTTALPAWAAELATSRFVDAAFGRRWEPLSGIAAGEHGLTGIDYRHLGTRFPHPLTGGLKRPGAAYYEAFAATPFGTGWVAALAEAALRGERPRFLGVSFSSHDITGHLFGAESAESHDHLARLSAEVARLVEAAEKVAGNGRVTVALTADHGVAPLSRGSRRLSPERMKEALRQAGVKVAAVLFPAVYLDEKATPSVLAKAFAALHGLPGVARVWTAEEILGPHGPERFRQSYVPGRSGDLYVELEPGVIASSHAASHGSPHPYDTDVPLVLWGAGICAGPVPNRVSTLDVAPTLATLLGVSPPAASEGRVLREVLCNSR
jgi:hypothetical protein